MFFGALILPAPQYAPDLTLAKLHVPPEGLGIAWAQIYQVLYYLFGFVTWSRGLLRRILYPRDSSIL